MRGSAPKKSRARSLIRQDFGLVGRMHNMVVVSGALWGNMGDWW